MKDIVVFEKMEINLAAMFVFTFEILLSTQESPVLNVMI